MKTFVKGTIVLATVILLSKLFGFLYRMQFMRVAGPETVGIYMTTYPAFIFFVSLAQFGLPLAVTKLTASHFAARQFTKAQLLLKKAIQINFILLITFIPIFLIATPFIANKLLHNSAAVYPLYVSLVAIPFVIFSGLIKAYLQGIQKIHLTAWSLFFEQIIRITLITLLFPLVLNASATIAAAQAMGITVLAEIATALFIYPFYIYEKRKLSQKNANVSKLQFQEQKVLDSAVETNAHFTTSLSSTSQLFHIALPTASGKLFGTFTWFLEPIVFLQALGTAGLSTAIATSLYGIVSGVHIPLLLFPAFIPAALSIVLVPAISSALARGHFDTINRWVAIAIRISAVIGCYSATIFFLYGDALAQQLFQVNQTYHFMQMLAPIFFFYYVQSPLMSILQALDGAKVAMWNSIYGGAGKLLCMLLLASIPAFSINGAIIAIGFGVLITTLLHMFSLKAIEQIKIPFHSLVIPYSCFLIALFIPTASSAIYLQIAHTIAILTLLLLLTKQIQWHDIRLLIGVVRKKG